MNADFVVGEIVFHTVTRQVYEVLGVRPHFGTVRYELAPPGRVNPSTEALEQFLVREPTEDEFYDPDPEDQPGYIPPEVDVWEI